MRAAGAFRQKHGRAPAGVWSAPGRVNLIGEHTDYNDGFVLPFALPFRIAVAASPRDDGMLTATTVGDDGTTQHAGPVAVADLRPGGVTGWAAYPCGVAWVLRDHGFDTGADLVIAGDVPTGAGLSSSHALQCAVALALLGLGSGEKPPLAELARWIQRSENDFVGAPTGLLDQTASLCCVAAHVLFVDVRSGEQEQIPFDAAAHGLEVLAIDTRVRHSLADSAYGDRRKGCERAAELLGLASLRDASEVSALPPDLLPLAKHVVSENERVLKTVAALRADAPGRIGDLLTESHRSLRDDYRVSCEELDVAVAAAVGAGALGARMTGGGFGGTAIALVPVDHAARVRSAVLAAFAERSFEPPRMFPAVPSAGAGRDL
ncbi:galactokinase [Actinokineospora xionganensis]|uniref:Galactokinase n=1 Tax=Actinokineospora xionganensis TaxID=2684470 RepID=A0ABR7L5B7_9PSEU|nr:galactokinase [Actinokineospora xionganensis]MBC6447634.1 galactokinase [Actinokineospora xionganensis]